MRSRERRRADLFLKLGATNLLRLDDSGWERLYDELAVAAYGTPRQRGTIFNADGEQVSDDFNFAAYSHGARPAIGRAKLKILEFLEGLRTGRVVEFPLSEERLLVNLSSKHFTEAYRFKNIETMIYRGLVESLKRINFTRDDLYVCSDPRCGRTFLPTRKPRSGKRPFCDKRHRWRVNQAEGRARINARRRRGSGARERAHARERSHRYYVRKVTAGRPNMKVARRPQRQTRAIRDRRAG